MNDVVFEGVEIGVLSTGCIVSTADANHSGADLDGISLAGSQSTRPDLAHL
jgi:hypothetical protein